jgi:hypothetical protein
MKSGEPFIDAHQHFWDLGRNPYPWLQDPEPIPFRYGDYSTLKRNYLPPDFERDTEGFTPVKTVHIEAEWDRANPVAETRWLSRLAADAGRPSACVAHAQLDGPDIESTLAQQAAFPLARGIRHKPVTAAVRADAHRGSSERDRSRDVEAGHGTAARAATDLAVNLSQHGGQAAPLGKIVRMCAMPAYCQIGRAQRQTNSGSNRLLPHGQMRRATHLAFAVTSRDLLLYMADTPHLEQQLLCDLRGHGINQ